MFPTFTTGAIRVVASGRSVRRPETMRIQNRTIAAPRAKALSTWKASSQSFQSTPRSYPGSSRSDPSPLSARGRGSQAAENERSLLGEGLAARLGRDRGVSDLEAVRMSLQACEQDSPVLVAREHLVLDRACQQRMVVRVEVGGCVRVGRVAVAVPVDRAVGRRDPEVALAVGEQEHVGVPGAEA